MSNFPEKMTVDEVHELTRKGSLQNFQTFDNLPMAQEFAKVLSLGLGNFDTQLYTQVDGAVSGKIVYLKGKHVVNRTGVYLVAWR